jgi:uncharacterized protein YdeI (YjbR/CyaY-like superfamily)
VVVVTEPTFFRTASAFRKWLEKNHDRVPELLIGFHRVDSGKGGLTYREALDEALCFGWIDGLRKRYEADSYTIRFTPPQARQHLERRQHHQDQRIDRVGSRACVGLRVFQQRDEKKSLMYSYEVRERQLDAAYERQFRANPTAWEFYQAQAPWYRRVSCYWVMSAKREETRLRRLATLIADSASGRRIKQLTANPKNRE